jgi:hypothetical protein
MRAKKLIATLTAGAAPKDRGIGASFAPGCKGLPLY